tara:strand:+ start:58 stop:639 length:582 start_codon:yes stop_codon:yes gene_type:complete
MFLIAVSFILFIKPAFADQFGTYIKFSCHPEIGYIEAIPLMVYESDLDKLPEGFGLSDRHRALLREIKEKSRSTGDIYKDVGEEHKKHKYICPIGGGEREIEFRFEDKMSNRGQCAFDGDYLVHVYENNKKFAEIKQFGITCSRMHLENSYDRASPHIITYYQGQLHACAGDPRECRHYPKQGYGENGELKGN